MKVDIVKAPPPLEFGEGEDTFSIQLKRYSGDERLAVFNAVAAGDYALIQDEIDGLVINWSNVLSPEGSPIPFHTKDDNGKPITCFLKFMGAIPLVLQVQVLGGILAFMGFPRKAMARIVESLQRDSGAEEIQTDPTDKPESVGDAPASVS